jgi:hypothetical protein
MNEHVSSALYWLGFDVQTKEDNWSKFGRTNATISFEQRWQPTRTMAIIVNIVTQMVQYDLIVYEFRWYDRIEMLIVVVAILLLLRLSSEKKVTREKNLWEKIDVSFLVKYGSVMWDEVENVTDLFWHSPCTLIDLLLSSQALIRMTTNRNNNTMLMMMMMIVLDKQVQYYELINEIWTRLSSCWNCLSSMYDVIMMIFSIMLMCFLKKRIYLTRRFSLASNVSTRYDM